MKSIAESRRRREPNLSVKEEDDEEEEEGLCWVNKTTVTWEDKASQERIPNKAWLSFSKEEPLRAVKMVILGAMESRENAASLNRSLREEDRS